MKSSMRVKDWLNCNMVYYHIKLIAEYTCKFDSSSAPEVQADPSPFLSFFNRVECGHSIFFIYSAIYLNRSLRV